MDLLAHRSNHNLTDIEKNPNVEVIQKQTIETLIKEMRALRAEIKQY